MLEEDGICGVGERLQHGDLLVNKHTPANTRDDLAGIDPERLPDSAYKPSVLSYKVTLTLTLTLTLNLTLTLYS